jgi:tRNA modification GTPase
MIENDTIVAIASGTNGAISIIRISGKNAFNICDSIFNAKNKKTNILESKSHTLILGTIFDNKNNLIDEVLVAVFRKPHSYTGEDSVEIYCHASPYIQQKILSLLINHGARLAKHGEFTMQAFLNGKIDLSQAEAVADIIASSSELSHKIAIKQFKGGFSNDIKILRNQLLHFASMIELELDFSEEDVEFANRQELINLIHKINAHISKLIKSFKLGNIIKNGVPIAIIGEPNVGKSTLLNTLLNDEKAIVSEIPGTTRDSIEDCINIDGIIYRFIDTAGIRETNDIIENMGIKRTYNISSKADIILYLFDAMNTNEDKIISSLNELKKKISNDKKIIIVINKIDKKNNHKEYKLPVDIENNFPIVYLSAKNKININQLTETLKNTINTKNITDDDVIVSNIRHWEALSKAYQHTNEVLKGFQNNIPSDLIATDLRLALNYLGEITGEISSNDILSNIFSKFCIGK